jgi:hypothetical protein
MSMRESRVIGVPLSLFDPNRPNARRPEARRAAPGCPSTTDVERRGRSTLPRYAVLRLESLVVLLAATANCGVRPADVVSRHRSGSIARETVSTGRSDEEGTCPVHSSFVPSGTVHYSALFVRASIWRAELIDYDKIPCNFHG